MKRYLLFCFPADYPAGGWNDFQGSFGTIEEAKAAAEAKRKEDPYCVEFQVIDSSTGDEEEI